MMPHTAAALASLLLAGCGAAPSAFDLCAERDYDGKNAFRMTVTTHVEPQHGDVHITATDSTGRTTAEKTVPAGHGVRWAQVNPPVMQVRASHGEDVREVSLPWPASHGEVVRVCSGDGWFNAGVVP
jgi:hypothetical protein